MTSSKWFWLIKTVYTGEGREALFTLTDEGYTAYFGLHETGALDATAIGNLRILYDLSSEFGSLFSAGAIPIIYILIGLKVGAELGSVLDRFRSAGTGDQ